MDNQSLYQSTLRRERENMEFWSLPLLETRADRQRREAAKARMIWFTAGVGCTFFAIVALALAF